MPDKRKEGVASKKSNSKRTKVEETETESLSYDPVHFIRSHSKNNDPADIQTQVSWDESSTDRFFFKQLD